MHWDFEQSRLDSCTILISYLYHQEIIMITVYSVPVMWETVGTRQDPFPIPISTLNLNSLPSHIKTFEPK